MKESQRDRRGEKLIRGAIVAVFAVLWLCIAFFVGCGTNSSDSVSYVGAGDGTTNPTATATVPFQDQPVNFLTSAEDASGGMAVSYIDAIGAGIYANSSKSRASQKGPAGSIISLTAKVLVNLVKNFTGTSTKQEFATVQNELNSINAEIDQLNNEAAGYMKQLAITQVDLTTYINNKAVSNYTENIDLYYASTTLKNLLYYSQCAELYCPDNPSPSPTVTALPYSIPTPSPIPMPTWPPPSSLASVQQSIYSSDSNCYVNEVTATDSVPNDIYMIYQGISSPKEQMLMAFVNEVVLNGPSTSSSTNAGSNSSVGKKTLKGGSPKASPSPAYTPNTTITNSTNSSSSDTAMNAYLLLEKYFLTLYCYQLKGLLILQNADNVLDSMQPNPPNPSTFSNYMDYVFRPYIRNELIAYNNAVNYLVVNLVDYRTKNQFGSDNNYISTGLAKDSVYYQVLARARILTVQILNSYGYNEGGLYGKVIVPAHYLGSGSITSPSPAISPLATPTFSPEPFPTPIVNLTGTSTSNSSTLPLTQQTSTYQSIFPYSSWYSNFVSCDNNWTVVDLYNTDLPAGNYVLTLNDGSSNTIPWLHSSNQLGSGTVMYYCPNGKSSTYPPTTEPTDTNTIKFGFFSGRWNFGYELFSNAPFSYWFKSSAQFQFTDKKDNLWEYPNPGLCDMVDSNFSTDFATYLYPYAGNTSSSTLTNKMGSYSDTFSDTKHAPWFTGYKLYLPFFMAPAPKNLFPQGLNGQNNVTWFYSVAGGLYGVDYSKTDDYVTYYGVYSEDCKTQKLAYLVDESNNLNSGIGWGDVMQTTASPIYENDLKTTCYYQNWATGTYSQYLQWLYVQLVYSGYVDIFNPTSN